MEKPALNRLKHLMQLREEVEELNEHHPWLPPADWCDGGTYLELLLDVPDMTQDSLQLSYDEEQVYVSGERQTTGHFIQKERPTGRFSRTFRFPEEVLTENTTAHLGHGVLRIRFEKKHPTIDAE